jgi:hypothetical protein
VRLVLDHRDDYDSSWAAIRAIAQRLDTGVGTSPKESLRQDCDGSPRRGLAPNQASYGWQAGAGARRTNLDKDTLEGVSRSVSHDEHRHHSHWAYIPALG